MTVVMFPTCTSYQNGKDMAAMSCEATGQQQQRGRRQETHGQGPSGWVIPAISA